MVVSSSSKVGSVIAYLQMMRPANILTAWADILLGYAISGVALVSLSTSFSLATVVPLGWLLLATSGLYGGGVVFNDVFDAELDAQERPERPIPSGRASITEAIALGSSLLAIGILAATQVSWPSAALAGFIAVAALIYDAIAKHSDWLGPLNMGLCRGANLLLGVSLVPMAVQTYWLLAIVPIVYIAAITMISRGEVNGGDRTAGVIAVMMIVAVFVGMFGLSYFPSYRWTQILPFAGLFIGLVLPAFVRAALEPTAAQIRGAVKTGIICLIVLDAAIASGFSNWTYGLGILALLPLSKGLAKLFAVT